MRQQKNLGLKALLSLAGAIAGYHHAALPDEIRGELSAWFNQQNAAVRRVNDFNAP
ncbi:Uncharacterised protein [Serratia rubidaea]|uniref:TfoX C-terminal domain-containing protein n=1 Tax=Serratia rubidaea TaxID=61652 RepID=A0A4V6YXS3_SERRU|nr:Uncharacterised protein [Serratia rubidaea]